MKKAELDLLERAFAAAIDAAINGGDGLFQTKSKLAKKLCDEGMLKEVEITLPGPLQIVVRGYAQTLLGNFAYCMSDRCREDPEL